MNEKNSTLQNKLVQQLEFKDIKFSEINDYLCLEISRDNILNICKILKDKMDYKLLIDIVGVDRFTRKNRFELIYNLWNLTDKTRLFVRAVLDSKEPAAESVTTIWKTADWMEREVFDMYGIKFNNHPDLRRIYLAEDFEYYPLRKDFPLMGIPGSFSLPKK